MGGSTDTLANLFAAEEGIGNYNALIARSLPSNGSSPEDTEQCNFEKKNSKYAFLPLYAFLTFSLFIGKLPN